MQQIISRVWLQFAVLTLLSLLAVPASAVIVEDLYSATATALDRSEEERASAFRNALATVLVKVSGNRQIVSDPDIGDLLENAAAYLQQYRYTENGDIWVAFDDQALERVMRNMGLPVWGADRPPVLLWLAVDWGSGRRGVVTADQDTELRRSIERVARSRGLPIIWPLFDSTDRDIMTFSDLWGGFSDKIDNASARYAPGAVLVGRASRGAGSRLFVKWELKLGGTSERWEGGLSPGLHQATNLIAERFASRGEGSSAVTQVAIAGIKSLADYARVSGYLGGIGIVRTVGVRQVSGDTVVFDLQLQGDAAQLFRILDGNNTLVAYQPTTGDDRGGKPVAGAVYYRLAR